MNCRKLLIYEGYDLITRRGKVLILTRKLGEQFIIGDNITVSILSIKGGQVRLGIDAPKNVPVHRKEIHDKINSQANKEDILSSREAE